MLMKAIAQTGTATPTAILVEDGGTAFDVDASGVGVGAGDVGVMSVPGQSTVNWLIEVSFPMH